MTLRLEEIWVYPVKSLAGVRVSSQEIDARGFVHDRRFMIVDSNDRFLSQRRVPVMASLRARLDSGALRIEDDEGARCEVSIEEIAERSDTREVIVWDDRVASNDAGDAAAQWLSARIGQPVRLVHMPPATERLADQGHARPADLVSFADGFSFLLIGEASVAALNERLRERSIEPVDARRFRANLIVQGAEAFAEDDWDSFRIGDVLFHAKKPCSRCRVVNVDPDRAEATTEPLATLATFRKVGKYVMFGQNLVHDGTGMLREGEPLVFT